MEDKEYRLILAYFDKTITDPELAQLQDWIDEDGIHLEEFIETIEVLESSQRYLGRHHQPAKAWSVVSHHINQTRPSEPAIKKLRWFSLAASFLLVTFASFFVYQHFHKGKFSAIEYAEISNPSGRQSKVLLPDGSAIYLGAASQLRYAKNFNGNQRLVYLNGEAFFDVVHNKKRPFVVRTGDISTLVLGTSFNIKSFAAEQKVAVTVRTGRVGVMTTIKGRNQLIKFLLPNQQMEINTRNGLYTFNDANAEDVIAWIHNDFIFYNSCLNDIAVSLQRRYGVQVEFTDQDLGSVRLTVKFRNMPLSQVTENLALLSGLSFTRRGDHIIVANNHHKGGKIMK